LPPNPKLIERVEYALQWSLSWMIVDIKGHPMVSGLCTGVLMLVPIYGNRELAGDRDFNPDGTLEAVTLEPMNEELPEEEFEKRFDAGEDPKSLGLTWTMESLLLRGLSATRFCLEFVDFLRGLRFGQVLVKLLASLTAKGPEIGNLRPRHRFLTGDPLLGRLFGIWSGIGIHAS
jgi:hypothetical protein